MPQMPTVGETQPVVTSSLSEGMSGEEVNTPTPELQAPVHEEEKVIIESAEEVISSNVDIPVVTSNGIEVVAVRGGFFNQQRLSEGAEFKVKKFEQLGEWMKCKDKALERKRVEFFKNKKAKK